jgi:hypothetical protein
MSVPDFHTKPCGTITGYAVTQSPREPYGGTKLVFEPYEIPRRSIIVCFLSLSAKADLNLPPFEIAAEPVFVNLLRSPGIDSQPGGPV